MRTQWNTQQLQEDFEVLGFSMGFVVVKRKSDGAVGSMTFERVGDQRIYSGWVEDK
jgi:hypothetical protein